LAELEDYKILLAERPRLKKAEFMIKLSEMSDFKSEVELEAYIKKTDAEIRRKARKDLGEEAEAEEEPVYPLLDRPDEELTPEEIVQKRTQRMFRGGYLARVALREEKKKARELAVSEVSDRLTGVGGATEARRKGERDGSGRMVCKAESEARGKD
jgi:actin-related protein 5